MAIQSMKSDSHKVTTSVVVTLFVSGCVSASGWDCPLPCWEGITPGVTSGEDALANVQEQYHLTEIDESQDYTSVEWEDADLYHADMYIHDNIVIRIYVWLENRQITVGDIISQIGDPAYVDVELPLGEDEHCDLSLQFVEQGPVVNLYGNGSGAIERTTYISELDLRQEWGDGYNPHVIRLDWQGYGVDYCALAGN